MHTYCLDARRLYADSVVNSSIHWITGDGHLSCKISPFAESAISTLAVG